MNRRSPPTNDLTSFPIVLALAQGFADLGLGGYNRFAEDFRQSQEEGKQLSHDSVESAIPAATVLAFAAELFLKALSFQRTGTYPYGHDLNALVRALPESARDGLKKRYEGFVEQKRNLLKIKVEMLGHSPPEPPPSIPIGTDTRWAGDTFEQAIKIASPLFKKLRYLYEEVTVGFASEVDFLVLLFIVDALRLEISQYKDGDAKITWGVGK